MRARSEKWARWLVLAIVIGLIALVLGGCAQQTPRIETRVLPVPSSKPYRYIKISPKDDLTPKTLSQISRHNSTHWKVKQAEKKAKGE